MEGRLNDLDYCYTAWQLLKDLEKVSYSRNEQIRTFQEKTVIRQSMIIGLISLILPVIVWIALLLSQGGIGSVLSLKVNFAIFATRLAGLLMLSAFLFFLCFMILHALDKSKAIRSLRNLTEKDLRSKLTKDIKAIDENAEDIVSKGVFTEPRLPEQFLSAELLPLLIRYFETGQVTTMKEATYSLKLELQNTGYYSNLIPSKTLLQKEKEYLSDESGNLEKKIEEGEEV